VANGQACCGGYSKRGLWLDYQRTALSGVLTAIHLHNHVPEVRVGYARSFVVSAFARYEPTIGPFNALLIPAVPQDTARKRKNRSKQPVLRRRPTSGTDRILRVEHQPIDGVYVLSIVSGGR